MPLSISKGEFNRLGDRLAESATPSESDLELLATALAAYQETLEIVKADLRNLGFAPTGRVKTIKTMVDKLRRTRGMQLSRVQDLAGARITVRDFTAQDDCRDKIAQFYIGRGCDCKVIDRRTDPRYGYRAVHLVVRMDGILIEIQIRTELQDSWAQIFERLADRWGRGIRYGEDPVSPEALVRTGESTYSRRESVEVLMLLSDNINDFEDARKLADELKLFASRMKTRGSEAVRKIAPEMMATKVPLEPADWEIYEDLADMYKKRMNSEVQRLLSLRETMSISQFMRLNELFAEITQLELNNEYDSLSRWEIQVRARLTLVANAVDEDEGM